MASEARLKLGSESYLRNRQQVVKIGTTLSDKMQITTGVPQAAYFVQSSFYSAINYVKIPKKVFKNFGYL